MRELKDLMKSQGFHFLARESFVKGCVKPIVGLLDEVVEGFVSGAEGMRSSIADKAWGSISGNRYRANKERGELLNKQIENGADIVQIFESGSV